MRHAARLLKLEARTQHIADALDGPPCPYGKPPYVMIAEYMDWLRSHAQDRQRSAEHREAAQGALTKMVSFHGEWTVEQGWRHYHAGGGGFGGERRDEMEPLPGWQDFPLSQYQQRDEPKRPTDRKRFSREDAKSRRGTRRFR